MLENTNTKQFYPGPILNNTLEITTFLFTDNTQIHVTYTILNADNEQEDRELTYGEDYEVEKVLSSDINAAEAALTASTGLVKLKNLSVKAGEKITVYRETPLIQDMQYPRTGAFPAASHEGALDSIVMQNQEQQEQIQRSLKVPISVSNFTGDMPSPVSGRTLKISADASRFELSELDVDEAYASIKQYKAEAQAAKEEAANQANIATQKANIATDKANIATQQANIATAKTTEVIESGNTAVSNIKSARDNAITDITNQENLSVDNVNTAGITQVANVNSAGTTQVNLAKEQVTLATNQTNIAKEQATIATSQASIATSKTTEVVKSGNTALSNIETAKSNALNDINTTGAEYVNNAEQYAQNALNSANNAKTSEDNALSYKNSAMESSQTATEQASIATTNANKAITSATNAKTSETNAKSSETRCEEILSRLGTAIKIKGRVDSLGDLPSSGNLDGDAYLVGEDGLDSYPEYYWYKDHWEFLGTTGTSLSWGLITGNIKAQTDLQAALGSKQDKGNYALKSEIPTKISQLTNDSGFINDDSTFVHKTGNETISGIKTFSSNPIITGTGININNSNDVVIQKQGTNFLRKANGGAIVLSGTNGVYVRPNGDTDTTGQLSVAKDGTVTGTKFVGSLKGNVTGNVSGSSGSCTGNSATATKATQDASGRVFTTTYATKTEATYTAGTGITITNNVISTSKPANIHFVTETYINGTSWYRLYDDNWCEQGGYITGNGDTSGGTRQQITFIKTFKDVNYYLNGSSMTGGVSHNYIQWCGEEKRTKNSVTYYGSVNRYWYACGYIA